jgi:hypothetical protein
MRKVNTWYDHIGLWGVISPSRGLCELASPMRPTVALALLAAAHAAALLPARVACGVHAPHLAVRRAPPLLLLVTEEEVEAAVERAEALWADALAARKRAEALSADSEEAAAEAGASAEQSAAAIDGAAKFGMGLLGDASAALTSSLDAGAIIAEAVEAAEEAERLEALAQEALEKSEAALAQHMIDFPDDDDDE